MDVQQATVFSCKNTGCFFLSRGTLRVCNARRLFSRLDIKTNGLDARTQFDFKYNCKYKHMNK